MKAPLVPVTLAFLSGILLGTYARLPPVSLIVVGAVSAGVALWRWRRIRLGVIALLLLWGSLGALRMAVWERHPDMRLKEILSDEQQSVQLHGFVVDDPVELFEPGDAHAAEGDDATVDPDRQVCVLAPRHRKTAHGWQPIAGRVRTTILSPRQLVRYGDEIVVEGQWSRVPAPGNPGQYDWRASLARQRVHGLLRVRPFDGVVVLRRGQGNPILAAVFRLRQRWERLIREAFDPAEAGLLLSLLLGQRTALDEELKEAFVETGTVHLLVISGFNVGLVALLLDGLLRLLGPPWRLRLLLCAAGLGGYCLLTGLAPPVTRATLMAWVVLGASALDRVLSWMNVLAAAALAILWVNPSQLFDPGFQLSFGAVLSLLLFTPRWQPRLEARLSWAHPAWLRRYAALSMAATSAVWAGLFPVLAWYFHLVSPVSMIANLLIAPPLSGLVWAGNGLLLLSAVWEGALRWGGGVLTLLLEATIRCVEWCHRLPAGCWVTGRPSPAFLAGYYGLLALSVSHHRWRVRPQRLLLCWAAAFAVWAWSLVLGGFLASRWLTVDVLDVGHGDGIVVRTPAGRVLVVDAGTQEAGRHRVLPFLRQAGISTVDALVLTHTDEDHLGGAIPLLGELRVRRLLTNGAGDDTMSARRVTALARERGVPTTAVAGGMRVEGDPDVAIEILHPPRGLVPGAAPASNDNSVVLRVAKGAVSILLTGDIEEAGLPWLLAHGRALRSNVLKVPHHGSRLGEAGPRFFRAVAPSIAVLSVGRAHHLPSPQTVRDLEAAGAAIYSTRTHGAIRLRTDGRLLEVRTFRRLRGGGRETWGAGKLTIPRPSPRAPRPP
jgi:competence protein ComEC